MEFFTDHWVLWACFFVPAFLWTRLEKRVRAPIRFGDAARVVLWISGTLLVIAGIHAGLNLVLP